MSATIRGLDSCGCCAGTAVLTPEGIANRPGLSAIAYRVGTHPEFKASLLARVSTAGLGALNGLRTRDDSDFSIALLDAFSAMADVLTFYQERIANESYLRTATERRSILELARLIGYELDPGVAASVWLAFTIEDAPGGFGRALSVASTMPTAPEVPPPVIIPAGTRAQTVPGPNELPQSFETVEEIDARAEWNAMRPRMTRPQTISTVMNTLWLAGTTTNLNKGDRVLISTGGNHAMRTVVTATADADNDRTRVELEPLPTANIAIAEMATAASANSSVSGGGPLSGVIVSQIASGTIDEEDLQFLSLSQGWDRFAISVSINVPPVFAPAPDEGVFVFRQHASPFAYNAPPFDTRTVPPSTPTWENDTLATHSDATAGSGESTIYLDRVYTEVLNGSWIVLEKAATVPLVLQVLKVEEVGRFKNMISGKSTRLTVTDPGNLSTYNVRETSLLVQSERLTPALAPIDDSIEAASIELDRDYAYLKKGRTIAITGALVDLPAVTMSEIRTLERVQLAQGFTLLTLDRDLDQRYIRTSVYVNANVAFATHGETVTEILGSGDATQPYQRFKLKQPPLTWVGADNETGSVSTLEVRVNQVRWKEVPFFYGHGPDERIYTIRRDDEGNSYVTFGDGRTGARLPTGENNVTAVYRRGIGLPGNARPSQISQMMNKPVGVKGATNPLAATGAGDPEILAMARSNASLTALTLGRVVSLRDYEDFARAYPGIAKAGATWSWSGERRHILLTLAGDGALPVDPNGDLGTRVGTAIRTLGDPHVALTLASFDPLWFRLKVRVKVHPDHLVEKVFDEIRALLTETFSFDARSFGQSVTRAEVAKVIHDVEGVIAVDIDEFYSSEGSATDVVERIAADPVNDGRARVLTLDPTAIPRLEVMS